MKITIAKALLLIGSINVLIGSLLGEFQFSFPMSDYLLVGLNIISLIIVVIIFLTSKLLYQKVLIGLTSLVVMIYTITLIMGLIHGLESMWYYALSIFIIIHGIIVQQLYMEYKEMNVVESYLWFDGEKLR